MRSLILAGPDGPSTIAGYVVVYVLPSLIVAAVLGFAAFLGRIGRRLDDQDKALAVLLHEVTPQGQPSLRELLNHNRVEVGELRGQLAGQQATNVPHHPRPRG